MRGFCFMIAFWGEEHRRYFTDWLVPSLLALGNLPAIENKIDSKFLIATTENDWTALHSNNSFLQLTDYIEPFKFPLDDNEFPIHRCGQAFVHMTDYAHALDLYGVMLAPDTVWSNNIITELQRMACDGAEIVLFPPVRQSQEKVFSALGDKRDLTAYELGTIALKTLHPEWLAYEWGGPYRPDTAGEYWRRMDNGILRHSICWMPLLIDYSKVEANNPDAKLNHLEYGGYASDTSMQINTIRDMNYIFVASFTPENEGPRHPPLPRWLARFGVFFHIFALRRTLNLGYLRRFPIDLLLTPIIWGEGDTKPLPLARHVGKKPYWFLYPIPFTYKLPWRAVRRISLAIWGDPDSRASLARHWRNLWTKKPPPVHHFDGGYLWDKVVTKRKPDAGIPNPPHAPDSLVR